MFGLEENVSELNQSYIWNGRDDIEDGEQGHRWHHKMREKLVPPDIALIGFPSDLGVQANKGRIGAKKGPLAIRNALANLAWHSTYSIADIGDTKVAYELSLAQQQYANEVALLLNSGTKVIALGGGHEIAWGSYCGLQKAMQGNENKRIGIINFDAHFDLRKPSPNTSSGTPFRQIYEHQQQLGQQFNYCCLGVAQTANTQALFEYAKQTETRYLLDFQCTVDAAKSLITPMLKNIDELYLTICLDAFSASDAPGVSAPSALGITPQFAIEILQWIGKQQTGLNFRWQVADIAEMNPDYDIDNRTAKLAARLIHEITMAI